jgi:hypothetical protein
VLQVAVRQSVCNGDQERLKRLTSCGMIRGAVNIAHRRSALNAIVQLPACSALHAVLILGMRSHHPDTAMLDNDGSRQRRCTDD